MSRTTTKIIIRRENGEVVSQYALGIGEHLIGRESNSGIFIEDDHISRQHAKLIISADAIEIEDLDSTSGTFLEGMAVRGRIPVMPGQKVHISDLYLDIEREGFTELIKGARLGGGRFTLLEKLGQGGMGAVWKALDEESGAHVALKLLPPEMSSDPSGLRDLEREVDKTKYLNHRNIVQIGGLWHTEGEPAFITVEYVEGNNLDELRPTTSHKLLAWASVQHYMLQLCDALEYAHSQRIAHRDIKPSNLLINRSGELKLADFGIAASIAGTTGNFTTDVLSAGTPPYMAPQQIEGRRPQASDDIYALGATFYDLLTGTPPFYQGEVIHQVLNVPPTPMEERLRELGASNDIPDYVGAMVMACLQKEPEKRPVSAAAIRDWIKSKGKKVDLAKGERMVWGESKEETTTRNPPSLSGAGHPGASIVQGEGVSKEKRSKALAYGIAAAILSIIIGTAVIMHEPGSRSGEQKEDEQGRPVISAKMQAQLKKGLVAYYPFNGNAKDESGNGNDGEVKGPALTTDRHGKNGAAYRFDGVDDYIRIADSKSLDVKHITITSWIKLDTEKRIMCLLAKSIETNNAKGQYLLFLNTETPEPLWGSILFVHVTVSSGAPRLSPQKPRPFNGRGEWSHLVVTLDDKQRVIYIDGEKFYAKANVEGGAIIDAPAAFTEGDLRIGKEWNTHPFWFTGSIDDVHIYNRALSEEEVAALYDSEKTSGK